MVVVVTPPGLGGAYWGTCHPDDLARPRYTASMDTSLVGPVADALAELSDKDRQILSMLFVEQLNSTDIAIRLGITPVAVRVQKHRLLRRLADNKQLRALFEPAPDELDDIFEEAATPTPDLQDF